MPSEAVCSLNHNTTLGDIWFHSSYPILPKIHPAIVLGCAPIASHSHSHSHSTSRFESTSHTSNRDVGYNLRLLAASTMTPQHHTGSPIPIPLLIFPIIHPNLLHMYYSVSSVRVHPLIHPPHIKVLTHFSYIQYGCDMQSAVVCSLNHDTALCHLGSSIPICHPHLHKSCYSVKV